jgi:hypothetical protein
MLQAEEDERYHSMLSDIMTGVVFFSDIHITPLSMVHSHIVDLSKSGRSILRRRPGS